MHLPAGQAQANKGIATEYTEKNSVFLCALWLMFNRITFR